MSPGRELDAIVGKAVMGWSVYGGTLDDKNFEFAYREPGTARFNDTAASYDLAETLGIKELPNFSTNPDDARLVWDEMFHRGEGAFSRFFDNLPSGIARDRIHGATMGDSISEIPPIEICLAALKALEAI